MPTAQSTSVPFSGAGDVTDIFTAIALEAGALILSIYGRKFEVTTKSDASPLTEADTAAEALILERLAAALPGIPVVAEEAVANGTIPECGERFILVDPLDGSKEFIARNGEFTVNIALIENGVPVTGVVYAPALKRIWWGSADNGAFVSLVDDHKLIEPVSIVVRGAPPKGLTLVGSRSHGSGEDDPRLHGLSIADFASMGSSLKFCLVAEGGADLYPRFGRTMEWDTAAGDAILRSAGGRVLDMDGTALAYGKRNQVHDSDFANTHFWAVGDDALVASICKDSKAIQPAFKPSSSLSHLSRLESESIEIFREVAASFERPVMMYSIGKDSSVLLHLARKAFYPSKIPFPLLHIDTTWKFAEMIAFRDRMAAEYGFELVVHTNPDGVAAGINPFDHGSARYTDIMKTQALRQALGAGQYDAAIGGARRDEEKSRAKEQIFSHRNANHAWDPKNQRPELWRVFNTRLNPGESMRVFPLSNWTELDIWTYIYDQDIPIVPLYFARPRPVVERSGTMIMVDDDRFRLDAGEVPTDQVVRFRTLGCYPLTGAIPSQAATLPEIIMEMQASRTSEREGRLIDSDSAGSMEKKKQEGYF